MYRLYVEAHLVPALGPVRLQDLRPMHVDQLLRDLRRAGKGPTTVKQARLVTFNAAQDVELPVVPRTTVHSPLSWTMPASTEWAQSTKYSPSPAGAEVKLMACWSDVDLAGDPKTEAGDHRRVDIGARTIGVLIAHQIAQASERASWIAKAAGLRPVRLHDLRHGAASMLVQAVRRWPWCQSGSGTRRSRSPPTLTPTCSPGWVGRRQTRPRPWCAHIAPTSARERLRAPTR